MSDLVQARGDRETVNLMRWADTEGVEVHRVDIVWERGLRACVALRVPGRADSRMATFVASPACADPLAAACRDAAARAAALGCCQGDPGDAQVVVIEETVETPRLAGSGRRTSPIPSDMFLEEAEAMSEWLLACSQDRRVEAPARRPSDRVASARDVWRSRSPEAVRGAAAAMAA